MISICPSQEQTKEWRLQQPWYMNGKQNECELFQKKCLEQITGHPLSNNTNLRLHFPTKDIRRVKNLNDEEGFEYTEDFDSCLVVFGITFFFNLKFVCDAGGAQTRTLRETYHFIQAQAEHLQTHPDPRKIFINILDGNQSYRTMNKFQHLLDKPETSTISHQIFIGDTYKFQQFWQEFLLSQDKQHQSNIHPIDHDKKKQELGQFYTTNYEYILQNLSIPSQTHRIIEPFVGHGDLLKFIPSGGKNTQYEIECYDIEPKIPNTTQRDTLLHPPCFRDSFVITNPPYLARNKSGNKVVFDKYKTNDLYKCFLKELTQNPCQGGIVIIPLNFWCSRRQNDLQLRKHFLQVYKIEHLNIFQETVFNDTDYSVCSFQFTTHNNNSPITEHHIPTTLFPENKNLQVVLHEQNFYMMGGEILNLPRTHRFNISRLTRIMEDKSKSTNLLVKCIDDEKPIHMALVSPEAVYVDDTPNLTARSYATLVIEPVLSLEEQQQLANHFNEFLNEHRKKYDSLFLSAYREHKRKRISFDLLYHITGYLLEYHHHHHS